MIATGFHVTDSPMLERICGADGRSLTKTFEEQGMRAYKGTTMVNFPNLFVLVGPNTGLGHNSMCLHDRVATELPGRRPQRHEGSAGFVPSRRNRRHEMPINNTMLWPDFTFRFRRQTKRCDLDVYPTTGPTPKPITATVNGVSA